MVLHSSAKKWRLQDLKENHLGTVDIDAEKLPRIKSVKSL